MKILIACVCLLFGTTLIAQSPQAFNYQGIARDASGEPIINAAISLRISILEGVVPGTEVYKESHYVTTNRLGLFNIEVGNGTERIGQFSQINWGLNDHHIKLEMDETGGNNFTYLGVSQLLSVPYALHAGNNSLWTVNAAGIHYNDGHVGIGTSTPANLLSLETTEDSGEERFLMSLNNKSISNRSFSAMKFVAGLDASYTSFGHNSETYDVADFQTADFGGVYSSGAGIHFTAGGSDGIIKMLTGNNSGISTERMRIGSNGHVGIGTMDPKNLFVLEGNVGLGDERFFMTMNNKSLSNRSFSAIKVTAGNEATYTSFGHNSETYDVANFQVADFGGIFTNGAGLHFTAGASTGIIKFLTGTNGSGSTDERLRIASNGYVGIGTIDPVAKLQISQGDVYIENIQNGVIMKSPNGSCWRMTINDDGSLKTTGIACPN